MTHIVGTGFESETLQEGIAGQAVSKGTGAVGLQGGDDEILHDFDFGLSLQTGLRFFEGSFYFWNVEPVFVFVEAGLDVTNALKVFVELVGVGF